MQECPTARATAGCVDFVLPPAGIAAELARMGRHPYVRTFQQAGEPPLPPGDADEAIRRICALLRTATGVDFELYKPATIRRRVARRLVLRKVEGLENYLHLLKQDRAELDALYEDIFIHVTSFFRDPEAFDVLRRSIVPKILANRPPGQALQMSVPAAPRRGSLLDCHFAAGGARQEAEPAPKSRSSAVTSVIGVSSMPAPASTANPSWPVFLRTSVHVTS